MKSKQVKFMSITAPGFLIVISWYCKLLLFLSRQKKIFPSPSNRNSLLFEVALGLNLALLISQPTTDSASSLDVLISKTKIRFFLFPTSPGVPSADPTLEITSRKFSSLLTSVQFMP